MNEQIQTCPTLDDAFKEAFALCAQAKKQGRRPVILAQTPSAVLGVRRALAAAGEGFGVEVETLPHWVTSLWELFGDGRTPCSHALRIALAAKLVHAQDVLPPTPGTVNLLARATRQALIYRSNQATLAGNEHAFVALMDAFASHLDQIGACEYCQMLEALSLQPRGDIYAPIVFDASPELLCNAERFFAASAGATFLTVELGTPSSSERTDELSHLVERLFQRTENDAAVEASGSVVCALAAGPTAQNRLVGACVESALSQAESEATIVVAAKDPVALFEFCAPIISKQEANAQIGASKRFCDTDAGRAVVASLDLVDEHASLDKLEAADYSFNPFAGIRFAEAFRLDQMHRGDRLIAPPSLLSNLAGNASDQLKSTLLLFSDAKYAEALDAFEGFADTAFAARPLYRSEQLHALGIAREALAAAGALGAPAKLTLESVANQGVPINAALSGKPGAPTVLFTTLANAAELAPASVDSLVISDLNVDSYPVRLQENALTTLLCKWGVHSDQSPLAVQRSWLFRAISSARKHVYLQRSLNDCEAGPQQAAVLFDDVMDCYRAHLSDYSDVDKNLGLPS
ncbi:MAG: hypothetical protein IJ131_00490, partial [Eggerthellaceae bacterium]|nr:hypothetical protein [Eggerthellaceae bacterium]